MKQQILDLKKKLLLVELPVKCDGEDISISHDQYDYDQLEFQYPTHEFRGLQCYDNILLPKGNNYKSVGKLTDITEEQFEKWVGFYEWEDTPKGSRCAYKDYKDGEETDDYWDMYPFDTAKESFFSYLETQGIYFENKNTLDKPNKNEYNFGYGHNEAELYKKHLKVWQEAEQKVWSKERCYIFEII